MEKQLTYIDQQFYHQIQTLMDNAKQHIYPTANVTMVKTYWEIGRMIVEKQGGDKRAEYGKGLIKELSIQMTQDYGKGYTVSNLKYMKQFYLTFPKSHAVRDQLSWTHYRTLLKVKNKAAIDFYIQETINGHWSTRQLKRQINSQYYERELKNDGDNPPIGIILCTDKNQLVVKYTLPQDEKQIYASKYQTYLPTQEQFQRVIDVKIKS